MATCNRAGRLCKPLAAFMQEWRVQAAVQPITARNQQRQASAERQHRRWRPDKHRRWADSQKGAQQLGLNMKIGLNKHEALSNAPLRGLVIVVVDNLVASVVDVDVRIRWPEPPPPLRAHRHAATP